jgi:hypothetical protein
LLIEEAIAYSWLTLFSMTFLSLGSKIGKEREVLAMENGGNAKVNAIFEARLPNPSLKPSNHADGQTRERYIRDKYERRKYYDPAGFDEYAASAAALPRSPPPATDTGSSVGPPSDAAKQRLEQRRARINKSVSAVDDSAVSAAAAAPRRKVGSLPIAKAPVSAPPPTMDLLDLMGGFGEETAKESPVSKPPASNIDLFDFVVASKPQQQVASAPVEQQPKAAAAPALDIMSLYNNGGHQAAPQFGASGVMQSQYSQPQMMAANGMGGGSGMPNMMMMPPQQAHGMMNPMHQMTHAMQNMHFSPQQQQQFYQQQQMMMMQQQQQQQMMMMMNNGSNLNHGGFGGPSMGGMPASNMNASSRIPAAATAASPKAPEKEDPFAQFGSNVFRS